MKRYVLALLAVISVGCTVEAKIRVLQQEYSPPVQPYVIVPPSPAPSPSPSPDVVAIPRDKVTENAPEAHCVVCGVQTSWNWYGPEGPFCPKHLAERMAKDRPKPGVKS